MLMLPASQNASAEELISSATHTHTHTEAMWWRWWRFCLTIPLFLFAQIVSPWGAPGQGNVTHTNTCPGLCVCVLSFFSCSLSHFQLLPHIRTCTYVHAHTHMYLMCLEYVHSYHCGTNFFFFFWQTDLYWFTLNGRHDYWCVFHTSSCHPSCINHCLFASRVKLHVNACLHNNISLSSNRTKMTKINTSL